MCARKEYKGACVMSTRHVCDVRVRRPSEAKKNHCHLKECEGACVIRVCHVCGVRVRRPSEGKWKKKMAMLSEWSGRAHLQINLKINRLCTNS